MRIVLVLIVALVVSACTTSSDQSDDPEEPAAVTVATVQGVEIAVPPEIADYRVKEVQVGDREMTLAIADNPTLRRQGLKHVTDLEDLDGMLFFWRHDGDPFWMEDTLIALDIVWFYEDGTYADRASMDPCTQDPCPTYQPADGLDFRHAIEAPKGDLAWVTPDTVIVYVDD